jgi:hypothetical protein
MEREAKARLAARREEDRLKKLEEFLHRKVLDEYI